MNKWFSIVFVLIMLSFGHISGSYGQERKSDSTPTFLQSQSAIVRLGVSDKLGKPKNYTATFVVTAPNGKQSKAQKNVVADEGWVYVDFPNEFTGDTPDYSTYATYQWKCLVGGKEVANGQFQWGSSRASSAPTATVSDEPDETAPRRETLKRRDGISWKDMPLIKGQAVLRPDTIVFGEKHPDSFYSPDEVVAFRTAKQYKTLVLLVGVQDNAGAQGGKHFQIRNENGVLFEDETLPNRRPRTIRIDISDSDVIGFTNGDLNGQPKEFIRYMEIYFVPK